jgi:hypothetical protein
MINYDLKAFERAFAFQIKSQDPEVTSFLRSIGGIFTASNGWKIKISKVPEINVFSKTIYLRGTDSSKNLRIDRTWNVPSNSYRDSVISGVSDAITELISSVNARLNYQTYMYIPTWDEYNYTTARYWASEVQAAWNGKFDSEGWGPNKVDPSKTTIIL